MLLYVFMVWPIKFCKYFEFCAKLICCLKICGECKKFCFGEFRLKILVFENHIISYSCIIVLKFQCFELILNVFSKNCVFPQIWCVSAYFDWSKIFNFLKREPLSVSIDRNSWNIFFLESQIGLFKGTFSKSFSKLSSLSDLAKAPPTIFCRFPPRFLQGFCPWRPVSLFCPFFCILFVVFMHFSCIVVGIFGTFSILGFFMIQTCFGEIDQWVFVLDAIMMILVD